MSRKKSFTAKLTKRLKKQNLKKHSSSNKPRYIAKADRVAMNETDANALDDNAMTLSDQKKGE